MKKLINKPEDVVTEALQGMAAAHPDLIKVNFEPNYVYRADAPVQGKVALVSGGGSGHEPMHGGFVGMGMLDAACPGEVFTSPTPDQMLEATKAADGGAGVVHIVKNYTGDVMNFEMAADLARGEGIDEIPFQEGDEVLAFVNSMGGTPTIELYLVYNDLYKLLEQRGIKITRNLIGAYITSLEMAGISITLLKLDDELTRLWDAPVRTPGLRWGV